MDHKKILFISVLTALFTSSVHAESLGRIGGEGLGPFGNIGLSIRSAMIAFTTVVSSIIGLITMVAGIWFLIQILIAGIGWLTSGGDKQKLTEARDRLNNAGIGLIVVVFGWAILALASLFFGVSFLDPASVIDTIRFQ